jgi:hypothetical protein
MMNTIPITKMLRLSLAGDAVMSAAAGLLMIGGAGFLSRFLDLPQALLADAGMALIPYVIFLGIIARRAALSPALVWAVIGGNTLWSLASVLLLIMGLVSPNAFGYAFVIIQAIAVLGFAEFQYLALRHASKGTEANPVGSVAHAR